MSYEEKGHWVYLVANAITFGAYVAIVGGQLGRGPVADIFYVPVLLLAIGAAVALSVVGRIAIEIAGEIRQRGETHREDVRDRDIGRFGEYVAGTLLAIGMVVPFGLALIEADHFWIANAIYVVFATSSFVGTVVKLVAYRRGL